MEREDQHRANIHIIIRQHINIYLGDIIQHEINKEHI